MTREEIADYTAGYDDCMADMMQTLDEIKAEIQKALDEDKATDTENAKVQAIALMWCLEIINKHIGDMG